MKRPRKPPAWNQRTADRFDRAKQFTELWELGLHDAAIAERMGARVESVRRRRNKLKLACNPDPTFHGDAAARAENEEPWEPLAGMVKKRCEKCVFWFSAPSLETPLCPDCRVGRGS